MTRIIINADDLGMSPAVNDAIFGLMAEGRISSATILANGPAAREAARNVKTFPGCSFGVHLNLTQFTPLTAGAGARLLTGETGQMSRAIESTGRATPALLRAAYEEWCAQITSLTSLGVPVSHLDSHNHIHTRPQFFPVLKAVQRRFGIRKVRPAKNLYSPEQPCARGLWWKKVAYNAALRHLYRSQTVDGFTELLTFAEVLRLGVPSPATVELMVHPGASYAEPETALLRSGWFDGQAPGATLIPYSEL